jgi:hypothetical protein
MENIFHMENIIYIEKLILCIDKLAPTIFTDTITPHIHSHILRHRVAEKVLVSNG